MLMFNFLLSCSLSILFIFLNHPLSLGGILFVQTIVISLLAGNIYLNFWFSYLLFLIMVGGMLILFIYMTSIASNEKFLVPKFWKIMMSMFLISMMTLALFLFWDNYFSSWNVNTWNFWFFDLINNSKAWKLNKFFNKPFSQLIIFLMIYLLITLIATVKISGKNFGSLRQK